MRIIVVVLAFLVCAACTAATRSHSVIAEFKRHNPCPATGKPQGACPGYVIDHIEPLCAGGADHPANMQWQTRQDSLRKDADERRLCRRLKAPIKIN
jgi:hypothetical protein